MVALWLAGGGVAAQTTAAADPVTNDKGYSYFMGLGAQRVSYQERSATQPVRSQVHSVSPLLITGALYLVRPHLLFSLDSQTTFYPGRAQERWLSTTGSFNGQPLESEVLQTNGYNLSQSNTQVLLHQRLYGPWFVVGGGALHTASFKRYGFTAGVDKVVELPDGTTVEESISEALGQIGLALDSERVSAQPLHYGLRLVFGTPLWRRVNNTQVPQTVFSQASGRDVSVDGRISWSVHPAVHLGVWGQWARSSRPREVQGGDELPQNQLDSRAAGVEWLWKF